MQTSLTDQHERNRTVFKIVFLTRRKAGITESEYFRHYADIHFPLAIVLPGLLAYYQQPIVHGGWNETDSFPQYDALSEYTFESREAADLAFASPQGKALNEDTGAFIDWDTVLSIPVTVRRSFTAAKDRVQSDPEVPHPIP
jgi:uncharacterized protein (TIGR02118 family)